MKTRKFVNKSKYKEIKRELEEARNSEYFHRGTTIKVLGVKYGYSVNTLSRIDRSKNYGEYRPSSVKPAVVSVPDGSIKQLFDAIVVLQERVAKLEDRKTGWLR